MKLAHGSDWEKRSTRLPSVGIMIAPEPFRIKKRIYFPDGKIMMEGAQYFDWQMVRKLIENHNIPDGWRMIKPDEAEKMKELYNVSRFGELVLGRDGMIVPFNMTAYKYCPAGYSHTVASRGITGYYWLDEHMPNSNFASMMEVHDLQIKITRCYMGYGLPLLLAKDL